MLVSDVEMLQLPASGLGSLHTAITRLSTNGYLSNPRAGDIAKALGSEGENSLICITFIMD